MNKISFKFIALAMALSICFSVVYSDYTYAIDLPKFVYDDEKTWEYNAINMISIGCAVGGLFVGPMTPWGSALAGTSVISNLFLRVMDANGWGDKPKEEQDELMKDYLKNAITYNSSTKEYVISDSFNDDLHIVVNNYLKETTGYYYFDVPLIDDVNVGFWRNKTGLDRLKTIMSDYDCVFIQSVNYSKYYFRISPVNKPVFNTNFVGQLDKNYFKYIDSDWNLQDTTYLKIIDDNKAIKTTSTVASPKSYEAFCLYDFDYVKDVDYVDNEIYYSNSASAFTLQSSNKEAGYLFYDNLYGVFALEPYKLRVWYDMAKYREFDLGKQPYYASQEWYNYDYSNTDNSTYSESFVDNSVKDSNNNTTYNEIVNNYSDGMTESEVAHLIETIMKNQKEINNTPPSSDDGGGSSGSGSGSGLSDLLGGIASLFDFFASLIGNIISMISNFLTTLIDSLGTFTSIFDGFSEFLSSAFGFIPKEAIAVIISGVTAIVVLAIIKFLKG